MRRIKKIHLIVNNKLRTYYSKVFNLVDFFDEKSYYFQKSFKAKTVKEFLVSNGMRPLISEKNAKRLALSMVRAFWKEVEKDMLDNNITFQFPGKFMTMKLGEVEIDRPNSANYYFDKDYYITFEMGRNFYIKTRGNSYLLMLSKGTLKKFNNNLRNGRSY